MATDDRDAGPRSAGRTAEDLVEPPALLLVQGDEDMLLTRAVARVVAEARALDPATEVEDHVPGAFDADALMRLSSLSLFGGRRVVVVRGPVESEEALRDGLLAYAASPVEETSLVLVCANGPRERSFVAAVRALKPAPVVVLAGRMTSATERRDFVLDEARRAGRRLTPNAAWLLLEAIGPDLRALSGAVEQLLADVPATVDEDDVTRFFRGRAETSGFVVADAVMEGDLGKALGLLRQALDTGTASVLVASAVAAAVRDLARVTAVQGTRGGAGAAAKAVGMPDWKYKRVVRSLPGWSEQGLARAVAAAARADAAVKGAGADDTFALERLVHDVVTARGAGRPGSLAR